MHWAGWAMKAASNGLSRARFGGGDLICYDWSGAGEGSKRSDSQCQCHCIM